jgi:glycerol-3-phosphate acyltransferase PlsX
MPKPVRLSLDAMGGDHGPSVVIPGAALALERHPDLRFLVFGQQSLIEPLLAQNAKLQAATEIRHTDLSIAMDEKPSVAIRMGRGKSSMWRSVQAVRDGEADACVSAGNTGALMAMSKFCLRTMATIERPAIAAIWPTLRGESVVLDVGATIGADAHQLIDFAILGTAMARALYGMDKPTVGLLNIGVEEVKGQEEVKEAGRLLREASMMSMGYHGFVEGDDIGKGTVDVVVTEGFTGNIALKTAEGTARQVGTYIRNALKADIISMLGAAIAGQALEALKRKLDPRNINGGVFLGLNGIVIKSHGGTDEVGFKSALGLAYEMARSRLIDKISEGMQRFPAFPAAPTPLPTDREANPA